jgi:hypothetical protein
MEVQTPGQYLARNFAWMDALGGFKIEVPGEVRVQVPVEVPVGHLSEPLGSCSSILTHPGSGTVSCQGSRPPCGKSCVLLWTEAYVLLYSCTTASHEDVHVDETCLLLVCQQVIPSDGASKA